MSDQKPVYEYALVRLVPRVEREEFINVGVILYCKDKKYLNMEFLFDAERLKALDHLADGPILEENLKAFQKIARGQSEESEISGMDLPSRFRWLTARRSTMVQTSVVHPGICQNEPEDIMDHLMESFVKP